ncbi:hypothetical protein FA95DRAFT_1607619 [Auriscalpium vulgare]|uniref:Uncharacterized protein n=1 Tax=Auriscalpium vulgare TaxID=40419 RepID=A0ACB8RNS7_9AGAM|nr:hypothetical protein FA95DRAFT_1607619 [Auriscalpium vulgare]
MQIHPAVDAFSISADTLYWAAPIGGLLTVRDLELQHIQWSNDVLCRHILAFSVLPRLRSLCITGGYTTPVPCAVLEQLERLERLVLSVLPQEAMPLPRTLHHLGYHFYDLGEEQIEGAQLLMNAARALSELRLVTVTRRSSPEVLKKFEIACEDAGVELVVYEKPWCFPRPGNLDWI